MTDLKNDDPINITGAINVIEEISRLIKEYSAQKDLKNEPVEVFLIGLYEEASEFLSSLPYLTPKKIEQQVNQLYESSKKIDKRFRLNKREKLEISEKLLLIKQQLKIDKKNLSLINQILSDIFLKMSELDFSGRMPLLDGDEYSQHNFLAIALNRTNEILNSKIYELKIAERNRVNTFFELVEKNPIVISTDEYDHIDFISDCGLRSFNLDPKKIMGKHVEVLLKRFVIIKTMLITEGGIQGLPVEFFKSLGVNHTNEAIMSVRPRFGAKGEAIGYLYYLQPSVNLGI